METKTLGFIGGGRITRIFLQGFENMNVNFPSIVVCDKDLEVLKKLKNQFPKIQITDCVDFVAEQEIVFIALHPPVIMETLKKLAGSFSKNSVVISLAPKISLEKIADVLETKNIARMIPNATSYINEGFNPVCFAADFSIQKKQYIIDLFESLGKIFETEEGKLEAYAIISAMLPTYFWFQWKEIQKLGIEMGLNEAECHSAIEQTLTSSVNLMYNSKLPFENVLDLIPVKPIAEHETIIKECISGKLIPLYEKIKP